MARFAALQPNNAEASYYYALTLWKTADRNKRVTEVESLLQKSVAMDPTFGKAYLQLGIVYGEQKDSFKAIQALQKAVSVEPGLEEAHYRLGLAYAAIGEKQKADQEISTYKRLSKESADRLQLERHDLKQFVYTLRNDGAAATK